MRSGTNPNLQAGSYRLVAKVYYGGAWVELALHLPFTIVSRSNGCGGAEDGAVAQPLMPAERSGSFSAGGSRIFSNFVLAHQDCPEVPAAWHHLLVPVRFRPAQGGSCFSWNPAPWGLTCPPYLTITWGADF